MEEIKGFEGLYSITRDGRVFGHKFNKFLSKKPLSVGYPIVRLCKNGSYTTIKIHRLVAGAYVPNPQNKACVNHINGIKTDNHVDNLEWSTYSENIQHAFETGLNVAARGEAVANSKLTEPQVLEIKDLLAQGIYHKEIAKMFNVGTTTITDINLEKTWRHLWK